MSGTSVLLSGLRFLARAAGAMGRGGAASAETLVGHGLPEDVLTAIQAEADALVSVGDAAAAVGLARGVPKDAEAAALESAACLTAVAAVIASFEALASKAETAVAALPDGPDKTALTGALAGLGRRAIEGAAAEELLDEAPKVHLALWALGVLRRDTLNDPDLPYLLVRPGIDWDGLRALIRDPLGSLGAPFAWGAPNFDPGPLMRLADGMRPEHLTPAYGETPTGAPFYDILRLRVARDDGVMPPGLSFTHRTLLGGGADWTMGLPGGWLLTARIDGSAAGELVLKMAPPAVLSVEGGLDAGAEVGLKVHRGEDPAPIALFGDDTAPVAGWIKDLTAEGILRAKAAGADVTLTPGVAALAKGLTLRIGGGQGDGFLRTLLSGVALEPTVDLTAAWTLTDGLTLGASGGLAVDIPVGRDLGPIRLDSLRIALGVQDADFTLEAGAVVGAKLGPIAAVVEGLGLRAAFEPGNGGGLDLGLKPPSGVGLDVDAGPVKGGGFLSFDPPRGRYAGALELAVGPIGVAAVGLLVTKMPDGDDGFSLVVIVTSNFLPIQLGFGFTLNALGGLLGINRTTDVDAIRAGLAAGTLDSIMFPRDPVERAPEVLRDIETAFPVRRGQHVFGPMAKLGWGTPAIVTAELGLLLELPSPLRLVILGKLRLGLPTLEFGPQIVAINMDVLGVIDFDRSEASIDAVLHDSRIAMYTLEGEMAFRLRWGEDPFFALSIGGLHPAFDRPPALPDLSRVAVSLGAGDNPRLRLEAYVALTSNTVQFGAELNARASAMGFTAEGWLGFDALFELDPFRTQATLRAGIALRRRSTDIMSVSLKLTLIGPAPWKASGTATATVFFVDVEVPFSATFGKPQAAPLPVGDAWAVLADAVARVGNWDAALPAGGGDLVRLRQGAASGPVHPMGSLGFRQRVLPFGLTLERLGSALPGDLRHFELARVDVVIGSGAKPLSSGRVVDEDFAIAQFTALTDDEKLSAPSFQKMEAGRAGMGFDGWTTPDLQPGLEIPKAVPRDVSRRTVHVRPEGTARDDAVSALHPSLMGAAQDQGRPVPTAPPVRGFGLRQSGYLIVATRNLRPIDTTGGGGFAPIPEWLQGDRAVPHAIARRALRAHLSRHPGDRDALAVVAAHEART